MKKALLILSFFTSSILAHQEYPHDLLFAHEDRWCSQKSVPKLGSKIPFLDHQNIDRFARKYSGSLTRAKWTKNCVSATAVVVAGLLVYSTYRKRFAAKNLQKQESSRLLRMWKAMSWREKGLLEGVADMILGKKKSPKPVKFFSVAGLKKATKAVGSYAGKTIPSMLVSPLMAQVMGLGAQQISKVYDERSIPWFLATQTKLLNVCNNLKKTAAYLDPESPVFAAVDSMMAVAQKSDQLDPMLGQMLAESFQLKMQALSGAHASEADRAQVKALFVAQMYRFVAEAEKVIGFIYSKAAQDNDTALQEQAQQIHEAFDNVISNLNKLLSALPPKRDILADFDAPMVAENQSGYLTQMLGCMQHIEQLFA